VAVSAETHFNQLRTRIGAGTEAFRSLVEGLGDDALLWRPGPDRWGIADCLEHLIATGEAYHGTIRHAMAEARAGAGGTRVYRPRLFGRLFLWVSSPRGRLRVKTMGPFVPPPASLDAFERFEGVQEDLLRLLDEAEGYDLQQVRVQSPASRFIRLTLGEVLELLVSHVERHLAQARRVRDADGFPG
jgi:hypothetical protein